MGRAYDRGSGNADDYDRGLPRTSGYDRAPAASGGYDRGSTARARSGNDRWPGRTNRVQQELARFADTLSVPLGGLQVERDEEARKRTEARAAGALVRGRTVLVHPELDPDSTAGIRTLAHEAVHLAQVVLREGPIDPGAAEAEANVIGAQLAAGAALSPVRHRLPSGHEAADTDPPKPDAKPDAEADAKADKWPRVGGGTTGPFTDEALADLAARLTARGVSADAIGDLTFHATWDDDHMKHAFGTLDRIIHGDGRFGNLPNGKHPGRLVQSWNLKMDDIGVGNYGNYKTILHYVDQLDDISNKTLGGDYGKKIYKMPDVHIAGLRTGVHPRAVYFAAAAQVIMDDKAREAADADKDPRAAKMKRKEGEGHYVPVGGFDVLLRELREVLTKLGYASKSPGIKRPGQDKQRADGIADGAAIYKALRAEVERMMIAVDAQEKGENVAGFNAREHREPAMRAFLLSKRDAVNAVKAPASDADSARAARDLMIALDMNDKQYNYMDRRQLHHGGGSIDPHGTDHAIGNAVDIYNSTGPVHRPNMGIRDPSHWKFVHWLIDRRGAKYGIDPRLRPTWLDAVDPEVAQHIAEMIRVEGPGEADSIVKHAESVRGEFKTNQNAAKDHKANVNQIETLRQQIMASFGKRASEIRGLGEADKKHLPAAPMPELKAIGQFMSDINKVMSTQSPDRMREILAEVLQRLAAVRSQIMPVLDKAEAQAEAKHQKELKDAQGRTDTQLGESKSGLQTTELEVKAGQAEVDQQLKDLDAEISRAADEQEKRTLQKRRVALVAKRAKLDGKLATARTSRDFRDKGIGAKAKAEKARIDRAATTADAPRAKTEATIARIMPETDPLGEVLAKLRSNSDPMNVTNYIQQDLALEPVVKSGGFRAWLAEISKPDSVIFDQPKIMVDALNEAGPGPGNFQGSHHWMVMPRETLLDAQKYEDALYADMKKRDRPHLRRILEIMAESDGGREILFPNITTGLDAKDKQAPDFDPELKKALDKRCAELGTTREAMLGEVEATVITPFKGNDDSAKAKQMMVRLGHRIR
jgi:hypothetical protein